MGCAGSSPKEADGSGANGGYEGNEGEEEEYQPLTQEEVNARIQCSSKPSIFPLGKTGYSLRYAYLSQRGYYPEDLYKNNQDSFKIVESFGGNPETILLGVFDGHGSDGDSCSYFVRDHIEEHLKATMKKYPDDFERAYKEAFVNVNNQMHEQDFDDSMSGTTAITAFFNNTEVFVANIGDSRAIIGEKKGKRVLAYSLSIDQTPYRQDERERVKQAGAVIMSCDQLEGIVEYHENWNVALGDELDNGGDPPRVWAPGKSFPGCAFTRSIGDAVAEGIGVFAEPELLCKEITPDDQFVVVASDGVWEFLTNQSVAEMILKFTEPLDACRAVVAEAYRLWLQYEVRTDDITMIVAFIDGGAGTADVEMPETPPSARRKSSRRESRRGSADQIFLGLDLVASGGENRPVRRGLSKEKRQAMTVAATAVKDEFDPNYEPPKYPKSEAERDKLKSAVKANFLFQHLNESQLQTVFDAMQRVNVKKGEKVITQGDAGDLFYVVESGEYAVSIMQDGKDVEILKYTTAGGTNPCFGELALMYSKPRAASVTATMNGLLWAMDRRAFRNIVMKSSSATLTRTLRSVDVLKSLSVGQLQRLEDVLTEVKYKEGDYVIHQGEETDTFYVIVEGKAAVTKKNDPDDEAEKEQFIMELQAGQYFGERALIEQAPRAANVIAKDGMLKCLNISKDAFEEVLGPLQTIIDEDRKWREKVASAKQLKLEAEGLSNVKRKDFSARAVTVTTDFGQYVLVTHSASGKEYTVKAHSKAKAVALGLQDRIMGEQNLLATMANTNLFVPLALIHFQDESYLYTVFKVHVVMDLDELLSSVAFDEAAASFYATNVMLALEHLHGEGIMYRGISPENIYIDVDGYAKLTDLRYAVKLDGAPPRDYCGLATYLSPEQVSGTGHSLPVDYWALGVLIFEMLTGSAPWLTGDAAQDSELNIYSRISAHKKGSLKVPKDFSADLEFLLNELLDHEPARRIGARGAGPEELRANPWFVGLDIDAVSSGESPVPYKCGQVVKEKSAARLQTGFDKAFDEPAYTGDVTWCQSYGSFKG